MTTSTEKTFGVDFIDPLFAIAIHIGFTHGLLEESWFRDWHRPRGQEAFDALVLLLGFTTVVVSWVGYHKSIALKPLRAEDRMGFLRFILDVILVTLYAFLLVKFKNLDATVVLHVWIYALFVVWDVCKVREHPEHYPSTEAFTIRFRRELVTLGWFLAFVFIYVMRRHCNLTDGLTLTGLFVATAGYRVNKEVRIWGRLGSAVVRTISRRSK